MSDLHRLSHTHDDGHRYVASERVKRIIAEPDGVLVTIIAGESIYKGGVLRGHVLLHRLGDLASRS